MLDKILSGWGRAALLMLLSGCAAQGTVLKDPLASRYGTVLPFRRPSLSSPLPDRRAAYEAQRASVHEFGSQVGRAKIRDEEMAAVFRRNGAKDLADQVEAELTRWEKDKPGKLGALSGLCVQYNQRLARALGIVQGTDAGVAVDAPTALPAAGSLRDPADGPFADWFHDYEILNMGSDWYLGLRRMEVGKVAATMDALGGRDAAESFRSGSRWRNFGRWMNLLGMLSAVGGGVLTGNSPKDDGQKMLGYGIAGVGFAIAFGGFLPIDMGRSRQQEAGVAFNSKVRAVLERAYARP